MLIVATCATRKDLNNHEAFIDPEAVVARPVHCGLFYLHPLVARMQIWD